MLIADIEYSIQNTACRMALPARQFCLAPECISATNGIGGRLGRYFDGQTPMSSEIPSAAPGSESFLVLKVYQR